MNSNFDTVENLIAYIRRYATEFLDLSGLRYHIREPEESLDFAISGERRRNIYLAVKESLHNVVKHANAERVSISFEIKNENLVVQVQDDGKGIDLEKANQFGNGLYNMRKRLHDIGGEMLVENRDGTLLTFIAPLEKTSQL
jgi:signal transduction histidine kinase